jgi:predicted  nucleic acid-binding Zn-ribbon protein
LAETSKYDQFIDELNTLEKQIYYFIQKGSELIDANEALNNRITLLERENDLLKKKVSEIEAKVSKTLFKDENLFSNGSLNSEEKDALKSKLGELIAKIDYHLRS